VKPKRDEPDHAYNIPRLNRIFFWSSLAALLSVVYWVAKVDYDRPWKHYQRDFRRLEAEKVRQGIQKEDDKLSKGQRKQDLDRLQTELTAARATLRQHQADLEAARAANGKAEKVYYVTDRKSRFTRAIYDAYRYEVEKTKNEVDAKLAPASKLQPAEKKLQELEADKAKALEAFQDASAGRDSAQASMARLTRAVDTAQKGIDALTKEKSRLENQLATLKPGFVNLVRNSPMFDFIAPNIKIDQIVIEDLKFDVNFQTIPRVDRCGTCHKAIDKPGWEKDDAPFRTHPRLDLFLSSRSPHPMDQFGCTVCHSGWDRSVDFQLAYHTPKDEAEMKRWEESYHWEPAHRWDYPMLPMQYVEASCYKCHKQEVYLSGAPQLNEGREIFERIGCWGCHKVEGKLGPKVGPSLRAISSKTQPDWVRRWVEDPPSFRPTTVMPRFFNLSNTNDAYYQKRNDLEVAAIADYLFTKSESRAVAPMPALTASAAHGQTLVNSLGCKACHLIGTPADDIASVGMRQRFGPNLIGLAQKTTPDWVYGWIKDPKHWNPDTRMPSLRLTDQEASDITAYLMTLPPAAGFGDAPLSEIDPQLRDAVTLEYLQNTLSYREAEKRLAEMSGPNRMLFLGEKLIGRYACYACHDIAGFEKAEPIGVELTEEGSKIITRFDFGLVHEVPQTKWDWIETKLRDPRIWDRDKENTAQEKLRMPQFHMTDAQRTAVTTFVLGLVKEQIAASKRKNYDPHEVARNQGLRFVADHNCIGCHKLIDFGGDFAQFVDDPSKAPPLLTPEGGKVQPDWLIDFLAAPHTIRPWLEVRMPTFGLDSDQINQLVTMFQGISRVENHYPRLDPSEMSTESVARGSRLFGQRGTPNYAASLKCNSCHPSGNILPESQPTQWGPDLNNAHERLRPEWVPKWLHSPQAIQPGTRMPSFFYDENTPLTENPDQDILDLRNYLWTLRASPAPERANAAGARPRPHSSR
jgi:cytochrome c2